MVETEAEPSSLGGGGGCEPFTDGGRSSTEEERSGEGEVPVKPARMAGRDRGSPAPAVSLLLDWLDVIGGSGSTELLGVPTTDMRRPFCGAVEACDLVRENRPRIDDHPPLLPFSFSGAPAELPDKEAALDLRCCCALGSEKRAREAAAEGERGGAAPGGGGGGVSAAQSNPFVGLTRS